MQQSLRAPAFLAAAATLAGAVSAQSIVTVVDGTGGDLQAAIQAAGNGDVLLVRGGPYDALTVDGKGLAIVVDEDESVNVVAPLVVQNLGPAQTVLVQGFAKILDPSTLGHRIQQNQGAVWIEACKLTCIGDGYSGSIPAQSLRVESSAAVVLADCHVSADQLFATDVTGLVSTNSNLALYECIVLGGPAGPGSGPDGNGGDALRASGGFVHLAGCTLTGGTGGSGAVGFFPGVGVTCKNGSPGGHGLVLDAGAQVEIASTTLAGGIGGIAEATLGCTPGPLGSPSVVLGGSLKPLPCAARGLAVDPSPSVGGTTSVTVSVQGLPGDVAAVAAGPPLFLPWSPACGVLLVSPAVVQVLGSVGPTGTAAQTFLAPALPPGLGAAVQLQAAVFTPAGELILGGAAALVLY